MDKYAIGLIFSHFQFQQDQVHVTWISLGTFSILLLSPVIVWILYSLVIKRSHKNSKIVSGEKEIVWFHKMFLLL